MDKLLFKRILITLISVLAIVYAGYLLLSFDFNIYPTENAVKVTAYNSVYADAFIIRDEILLSNDTSGVLSYSLSDGDAVNLNGEIAKVFSTDEDAAAQTKADELEQKMISLQKIQKNSVANTIGIDTINSHIKSNMMLFLSNTNNGNFQEIDNNVNDLVLSINQRQLYTNKVENFDSEIANLQSQIEQLRNSSGSPIGALTSKESGYFSSHCDGYENAISYADLEKLKLSDLDNIKKTSVPNNTVGKIIKSLNWYIACKVPAKNVIDISLWDGETSVLLANVSNDYIPVTIERISQENKDSDALVLLKCNYMSSEIIEARNEPVNIVLGKYTGLRISKRAIHDDYLEKTTYDENGKEIVEKKKVQGVYVLYGNEVQFKQISILYADEDYVICDESPDPNLLFNGDTISLYDKIITKGDDLYDGKVIE